MNSTCVNSDCMVSGQLTLVKKPEGALGIDAFFGIPAVDALTYEEIVIEWNETIVYVSSRASDNSTPVHLFLRQKTGKLVAINAYILGLFIVDV